MHNKSQFFPSSFRGTDCLPQNSKTERNYSVRKGEKLKENKYSKRHWGKYKYLCFTKKKKKHSRLCIYMYLLHIPDKWMPFAKCKHFQKKEYFSYGTHTFKHLNKKANIFKESMTNRGSYTAQGIKARDTILQLQTVLGLSLLTF